MEWLLLVVVIALAGLWFVRSSKARQARELSDAREEALRWYERLGGQIMNLHGDEPAVRQALADAGERYNAAGAQLERATTVRQYALVRETALEGLAYVRAARIAMGLDPGPDLPMSAAQARAGSITKEREVDVQGHVYRASPHPSDRTPYYYPGGYIHGRPVPGGWYSEPWWKTALVAGAWGLGSMMVFNALLSPMWGDSGYDAGFQDGLEFADAHGWDAGEAGADAAAGDVGGADFAASDFGGMDFGGMDFGGGDFGGGDFGGF